MGEIIPSNKKEKIKESTIMRIGEGDNKCQWRKKLWPMKKNLIIEIPFYYNHPLGLTFDKINTETKRKEYDGSSNIVLFGQAFFKQIAVLV